MRFGLFDFDPATGSLTREGVPLRLQPQPARVLALLVARAGEVVTREELRQQIWGTDTFVDFERGLNFCIAQIRSAVGDSAASPRFVETIPRRGYRFIAPVSDPVAPSATFVPPVPGVRPRRRVSATLALLLALAAVGAGVFVAFRWVRSGAGPAPIRLAVVPFDNETGDASYDEVARGVADATVARLAAPELVGRLNVIGNAAILQAPRDKRDLQRIGRELGVGYVVLGQVKRDRAGVRLVAHLIRVSDQSHLWASTFDRPSFDLAVQAELAERIAQSVAKRLSIG